MRSRTMLSYFMFALALVSISTADTNECANNPCQNGGTCVDGTDTYTCNCNSGFSGDNCQIIGTNECANNPCQNGGTCVDGTDTYTCNCDSGFSGDNCHITGTNECANNPCQNGGTCVDGTDTYTCNCDSGFSGDNCQITGTNECANNPCQNGGTCVDGTDTYTCNCDSGFSGDNCQITCVANCDVCRNTTICTTCKTGYILNSNVCDLTATKYHAQFKITSQEYTAELADVDSPEYQQLAHDVNTVLEVVYKETFASDFMDIKNNIFSKGSIVCDYEVWLNVKSTDSAVQKVLVDYVVKNNDKLGNFTVTVVSKEKSSSSKAGVIVGSVLGSVAFIAIIVGVLVYYFKRSKKVGNSEDATGGNGDADHEVHSAGADRKRRP